MTLSLFDQITFVHQTDAEIQNLTLFQKELFIPKKKNAADIVVYITHAATFLL